MSYLGTYRAPNGRSGRGSAMGDVPQASDMLSALAAQVNRFGPSAPTGYQIAPRVFQLVAGKLDADLALSALLIYQRRATDSYNQFHDASSAQAITKANAGFSDPVGFVSQNMAEVTQVIGNFADAVGLPPAITTTSGVLTGGLDTTTILLGVGVALALWMATR